ncbi:MAG: peptidoglycan-associated lipoprotein Pal [Elusimicrobia bacterium]|nr:peptidoglycan-associated lipoprotein Pal [Elusimicrobiota bacterium]MDE2237249.1 peptidoglycan-associated lipoprotein Pal [Elusimicrobiota bacterium]MDE2424970.1 peptidoglycan-associated lipoprotein Pal [Elusimicrobiota bacterium]
MKTSSKLFFAAVSGALLAACATPSSMRNSASRTQPAVQAADAGVAAANQPEPSVRDEATQTIPELSAVHFPFDKADLSPADEAILASNAAWLKSHPDMTVQVAGHCDQRGTTEYNLALGQRRASAVRDYYRMLGVSPARVATISYGKEKPLCQEATQACWAQNRRAETLAVMRAVSQNAKGATGL